jgi:hypothetical protein
VEHPLAVTDQRQPWLSYLDGDGYRILRIDYTGRTPDEHIVDLATVSAEIERQRDPLLLMTLASDRFTAASTAAIKRYVQRVAPRVQANAIVTPRGFRRAFLMTVWTKTGRPCAPFRDEEPALAWLRERRAPRDPRPGERGRVKRMLDTIVATRGRSNPLLIRTTRTKLILAGLNPSKFDASTPDDPALLARVRDVAREYGVCVEVP